MKFLLQLIILLYTFTNYVHHGAVTLMLSITGHSIHDAKAD